MTKILDWPKEIPCSNSNHCKVGVCDVCFIVRGDTTDKPVKFCPFCKAWICEDCKWNVKDRGLAAYKVRRGLASKFELKSLEGASDEDIEKAAIEFEDKMAKTLG